MTITQLEYALELRRNGGFKTAADHLGMTQPGLSLQIQKLENELGIQLFDRSVIPVEVTEIGHQFLNKAEDIVRQFNKLRDFHLSMSKSLEGKIKLGIIPTLAPFLVPLFAEELQLKYPDFHLDIYELTTENIVKSLRAQTLDVGIISTPARLAGLESRVVFYERFFLYQSSKNTGHSELKLENLDYSRLWLLEEGNCFRDQINNFCDLQEIRKNKTFIYHSHSIDSLVRLVEIKGGYTILPELTTLILHEYQEERLSPIGTKARELSLLFKVGSEKVRFFDTLFYFIQKNIPSQMLSSKELELVDPEIKM